jgi:hypothetical protein
MSKEINWLGIIGGSIYLTVGIMGLIFSTRMFKDQISLITMIIGLGIFYFSIKTSDKSGSAKLEDKK